MHASRNHVQLPVDTRGDAVVVSSGKPWLFVPLSNGAASVASLPLVLLATRSPCLLFSWPLVLLATRQPGSRGCELTSPRCLRILAKRRTISALLFCRLWPPPLPQASVSCMCFDCHRFYTSGLFVPRCATTSASVRGAVRGSSCDTRLSHHHCIGLVLLGGRANKTPTFWMAAFLGVSAGFSMSFAHRASECACEGEPVVETDHSPLHLSRMIDRLAVRFPVTSLQCALTSMRQQHDPPVALQKQKEASA